MKFLNYFIAILLSVISLNLLSNSYFINKSPVVVDIEVMTKKSFFLYYYRIKPHDIITLDVSSDDFVNRIRVRENSFCAGKYNKELRWFTKGFLNIEGLNDIAWILNEHNYVIDAGQHMMYFGPILQVDNPIY